MCDVFRVPLLGDVYYTICQPFGRTRKVTERELQFARPFGKRAGELKFAFHFEKSQRRKKIMTDQELNEFDSAVKMTEFFATNNNLLKTNAKAVSTNAALLANIEVLESAGANRISASGLRTDGTADKRTAKSDLYKYLRKIAGTGKTIKKEEPDFDNKFKIPRGNLSGQQVIDTANAFANDFTPSVVTKFNDYGMSGAIPTILTTKVGTFESARTQQNSGKGSGVAATAQTKAAIANLKKNRRTQKVIVLNMLEENGDAGLIAEWKSACKIEKHKPTPEPPTPPNP